MINKQVQTIAAVWISVALTVIAYFVVVSHAPPTKKEITEIKYVHADQEFLDGFHDAIGQTVPRWGFDEHGVLSQDSEGMWVSYSDYTVLHYKFLKASRVWRQLPVWEEKGARP